MELGIDLFEVGIDLFEVGIDLRDRGIDRAELGIDPREVGIDCSERGIDPVWLGIDVAERGISCLEREIELLQRRHKPLEQPSKAPQRPNDREDQDQGVEAGTLRGCGDKLLPAEAIGCTADHHRRLPGDASQTGTRRRVRNVAPLAAGVIFLRQTVKAWSTAQNVGGTIADTSALPHGHAISGAERR